ncbi:MAG: hypothetical protein R6U42_03645, partial [Halomonas sp.]
FGEPEPRVTACREANAKGANRPFSGPAGAGLAQSRKICCTKAMISVAASLSSADLLSPRARSFTWHVPSVTENGDGEWAVPLQREDVDEAVVIRVKAEIQF